jgi:hypothetical protein
LFHFVFAVASLDVMLLSDINSGHDHSVISSKMYRVDNHYLLDWQMVSHAEGVGDQHMDLFGVYEDDLLVHMGPSKGDQDGTEHAAHP